MKILYVSSEAVPFCKTGGLADVAGSLPPALAEQGAEVAISIPLTPPGGLISKQERSAALCASR